MRNLLLSIIVAVCTLSACTGPGYTIKGEASGREGNVILLTINGRNIDTLSTAKLKDGKFTVKGSVADTSLPELVYLTLEGGMNNMLVFFLENANYTAVFNSEDPSLSTIEGTQSQTILNEFRKMSKSLNKEGGRLQEEYKNAKEEGNQVKADSIEDVYDALADKNAEQEKELLRANNDNFVASFIVSQKMQRADLEEIKELYEILSENARINRFGKEVADKIAKLEVVSIGQVAPDFTLNTDKDELFSLSQLKGKAKVIDFWASWCGPCRNANPEMVKLYNKYHKKGLEVLGVSVDKNKEAWLKAIADDKLPWKQVIDDKSSDNSPSRVYNVAFIPHVVLLDANNVIIAKNLHGEELENKIKELLK
ncbi:MAG: AhpC/TSA family protein [Culturomica sp.]|jgi:peroxiredoxin|nr:AhpC/TSA family protein [Culturomica sp.]